MIKIIFILLILFILIIIFIIKKLENNYKNIDYKKDFEDFLKNIGEKKEYNFYKKNLFTKQEYKFFKMLNNYLEQKEKKYYVLSKVRLADFIKNKDFKDFTKISQKHIDFIILDTNLRIKTLIELDGYSHKYTKTIKNDIFKENLFKKLDIPFIRFKNKTYFDFSKLEPYLI